MTDWYGAYKLQSSVVQGDVIYIEDREYQYWNI